MAAVLPGSPDLADFWGHLAAGRDLIRDVPADRTDLRADPATAGVRGGFLAGVRRFDARLFGISPNEAALMDPQQRLFLETAWRAVEDAGYRPTDLAGTVTGLFVGVSTCDYDDLLTRHGVPVEAHTASGVANCILANRVSHVLDLRGPSEAVDTACSSSLVAVHRAVRAIANGECRAAIAGGVNLTLSPGLFVAFSKSGMTSSDGTCKAFDERADGYGRGEGCGAVLLKPLTAALADGDQVHGVILGSAVNHGGRSTSLTAPNPQAQARVLVDAYRTAKVDPATVTYLEAHGTGTRLGDPVEIEGMKKAFAELYADLDRPPPERPHVAVASVKTNIGHLEPAAGIAGLLKVLLCMRHGQLPPSIHFERPNPYLRLDRTPFFVNDRLRPWDGVPGPQGSPVRRAGVSSFGFGGTNAHVVLESYEPHRPAPTGGDGPQLLALSAPSAAALDAYARAMARFLAEHPEVALDRVAYTLQVGREPMAERLAVVVGDRDEAVRTLAEGADGEAPGRYRGRAGRDRPAVAADAGTGELAAAWVDGAVVDWASRWRDHRPRRASLPGFPFADTEFWFDPPARPAPARRAPLERREDAMEETSASATTVPEQSPPGDAPPRAGTELAGPAAQAEPAPRGTAAAATAAVHPGRPKIRLAAPVRREPPAPAGNGHQAPAGNGHRAPAGKGHRTPARDEARAPDGAPASVGAALRERLSAVLGVEPADIAPDTPFADLGLDSIFRMELVKSINERFALDLQAAELYEHDTVERLCAAVEGALRERPGVADAPTTTLDDRLGELVARVVGRPLDPARSFADNGLTSFDMLRVVSVVEKRLGAVRKTLLFDHSTVPALAAHLAATYGADAVEGFVTAEPAPAIPAVSDAPDTAGTAGAQGGPRVVRKRDLSADPALREVVAELDERHAKEAGLAGRDIAPLLFLDSRQRGYLHFSQHEDNLLAWNYVGTEEDFPELVAEYVEHARSTGLKPNVLSVLPLREVAGRPFTATPFGAIQRLEELTAFTLDGGRMSRLRYMVRRFSRAGDCRTVEYRSGDDPAVDAEIAEMLDRWTLNKQMVNPYVATVRAEIRAGRLDPIHRVFLTYLGEALANVVVITRIRSENGYLLDVEFYPPDMPLGGLEYAIVEIISALVAEGCTMFSFGASFGVKVTDSPNAAPEVETALAELRAAGTFGEGNFQFKNKFRPTNIPIYLCQPDTPERTSVSDVILMIANPNAEPPEPAAAAAAAPAPAPELLPPAPVPAPPPAAVPTGAGGPAERAAVLAAHGYNPLKVPGDAVPVDLITDSWAELDTPAIERRMRDLTGRAAGRPDAGELTGHDWLPFGCVVPTASGRSAEALLCRGWPGPRGVVVHNGLFPTWYLSLIDAGFEPVRLPGGPAPAPFAGDLDVAGLAAVLTEHAGRVSFVCVELSANAGGGHPVAPDNLRRVAQTAAEHGVPLVLDGARAIENAVFATEHDPDRYGDDPWRVLAELLGCADAVTLSLTKDFGVTSGGLLATRHPVLAERVRDRVATYGREVGRGQRRLLATALADRDAVLDQVRQRMAATRQLWQGLTGGGVPLAGPPGGHCVLVDVGRIDAFAGREHPVMSFLAWAYREAGVRGAPHLDAGGTGTAGRLVRLAVPVGMTAADAKAAAAELAARLRRPADVPDLVAVGDAASLGAVAVDFRPAATVPDDVKAALREGYTPLDENLRVLREHQPAVEHHLIRTPGGEVEAFSAGSGPALLLMHPFNIGAGVFASQFAGLADRFRVLCVHHPGAGRTTAADDITLPGIARLFRGVLSELGETGPVHVGGASFGGLVALTYALDYPAETASLVLIGSSYKIGNRVGEINRLEVVAAEDFDAVIAHSGSRRLRDQRPGLMRLLLRAESMDAHTGLRYLDVFAARPDLAARLSSVAVPTMVVQGRHDTVVPRKAAHLLHGTIPDVRYEELPDAGHFPTVSHPDEVNGLIADFIAGKDG
jgi:3-oxoacyl-(acyl-carrier-protein) synthase/tryptophanase/pimeloyl-ACP methyl ester carboxylesterase/acyl carrier protein